MTASWTEGVSLVVPVAIRVRMNRIGPRRQRCPVCGLRRVVYAMQATSPDGFGDDSFPATSEHRCASCWGLRESTH